MRGRRRRDFEVIEGGSSGEDGLFSVADYLQLAQLGHRSVVVVIDLGPELRGEIAVHGGEAWSARDAHGEGESAFRRLLLGTGLDAAAPATVEPFEGTGRRNLHRSLEALLLDCARSLDETSRPTSLERPVEEPPRPTVHHQGGDVRAQHHFDAILEEAVEALLRKDYAEAHAAFLVADELRPGDTLVRTNLKRLCELGFGDGSGDLR